MKFYEEKFDPYEQLLRVSETTSNRWISPKMKKQGTLP